MERLQVEQRDIRISEYLSLLYNHFNDGSSIYTLNFSKSQIPVTKHPGLTDLPAVADLIDKIPSQITNILINEGALSQAAEPFPIISKIDTSKTDMLKKPLHFDKWSCTFTPIEQDSYITTLKESPDFIGYFGLLINEKFSNSINPFWNWELNYEYLKQNWSNFLQKDLPIYSDSNMLQNLIAGFTELIKLHDLHTSFQKKNIPIPFLNSIETQSITDNSTSNYPLTDIVKDHYSKRLDLISKKAKFDKDKLIEVFGIDWPAYIQNALESGDLDILVQFQEYTGIQNFYKTGKLDPNWKIATVESAYHGDKRPSSRSFTEKYILVNNFPIHLYTKTNYISRADFIFEIENEATLDPNLIVAWKNAAR